MAPTPDRQGHCRRWRDYCAWGERAFVYRLREEAVMPPWLLFLRNYTHAHPFYALVIGGVAVYLGRGMVMAPPAPAPRPVVNKAQTLPSLGAERAVMEKTLLDVQKENAQLKTTLVDQEKVLRQIQQQLQTADRERKAEASAQDQRMQEVLKRAQELQKTPAPPAPKPAAPQKPLVITKAQPQEAAPKPSSDREGKVWILRHDKPGSFAGSPPAANRADIPYLPAGSFAVGRVVTGAMATSRANGALPMLFSVTRAFTTPFQQQGPGRDPLAAAIAIQGCFILGKAAADLSASRAIIQLDLLSCVWPDGETYERPIRGYATDKDGTLGIVGRVETHTSAVVAKAALGGMMQEASAAFGLARSAVGVTQTGGS